MSPVSVPEGFIAGVFLIMIVFIFGVVPGYAIGYRHGVKDTKPEPEDEKRDLVWADDQWIDVELPDD